MAETTPEILTMNEAAAYLRVSRPTMRELLRRGDIPFVMVGSTYRIHKIHLDGLLHTPSAGGAA